MILLERLRGETERSYALRNLKENIIHLELPPGSLISENELSARLGISRTPVREALIELARVRIVRTTPQKRGCVAPIDYDLIDQAGFMRATLESAVVALCCEGCAPEALLRLEENVRLQKLYLESGNSPKIMELDDRFHEMLFEIARKEQIYFMVRTLLIHFDRVRYLALDSVKDLKIVRDHAAIVDAIRARDAETARGLMERHLRRYQEDAREIRDKYPQYMGSSGD